MTPRTRALCAVLLTLAAGLAAGTTPGPGTAPDAGPSLLLVTIDTWRWDYLGASGSRKVETPNLNRLAASGIYEREAVTPVPLTTPAHATIMTGLDPMGHAVLDCVRYALDGSIPTLAEAFAAAGYATAAHVSSETLKARFGLARGFGTYDDSGMAPRGKGDWIGPMRDGREVTDAVLGGLRALPPGRKAFVWAHYFDLHLPHRPRPGLDARYPRDPYAAQAAFVDGEVGRLMGALKGDAGRTWRVVVVGDHGEGLGEKGEDTHGIGLYRATLHVPLILHPKPEAPLMQPKPWGLVDLAPTIREWFGLPAVPGTDGVSLFRQGGPKRPLFAASAEPTFLFGVEPSLGVRQGTLLYLRGGGEELFDLASDPGQEHDLAALPERNADLALLRGVCDRTWPPGWPLGVVPPSLRPSLEELNNLRSLGYIAGPSSSGGALLPVPVREVMKDKSEWDREREAAFRSGQGGALMDLYRRLLKRYPNSYALRNWFGPLLARAGLHAEAIAVLLPASRIYPEDATTFLNLGAVYLKMGRAPRAKKLLERALQLDPDNPRTHKLLGVLYADHLREPGKAVGHYRKYLDTGGDEDAPAVLEYIRAHERPPGPGPGERAPDGR